MKIFKLIFNLGLIANAFAAEIISTKANEKGDVVLIFTATSNNTKLSFVNRNEEGLSSVINGNLMKGQSYVQYVRGENISNDAFANCDVSILRDGKYFLNSFENILYTSLTTNLAWQENFVPSVDKKSYGKSFYLFVPSLSGQKQNINVLVYNKKTNFKIFKISNKSTTKSGFTSVDFENKKLVLEKTIHPGEDLIHFYKDGIQLLEDGSSYYVEADQDVSVQFGSQKLKEENSSLRTSTEMVENISLSKDNFIFETCRTEQWFCAENDALSDNKNVALVSEINNTSDDSHNKEISTKEEILLLFPNEHYTKVFIETKYSKSEENSCLLEYIVLDIDGVEKLSGKITKNTLAIIDLNYLERGEYEIIATSKEGKKYTGKIFKP